MEKPTKDMSFAEFSSLRQRKLNAQESAATTAAKVKASAGDHFQTSQNPHVGSGTRLQWTRNRGYSHISLLVTLSCLCLWGLHVGIVVILTKEQKRESLVVALISSLWWLQWAGAVASTVDALITITYFASNLSLPNLLVSWDIFLSMTYPAVVALAGPRTAGCITLLRLCKVVLHIKTIDKEHADESDHLSSELRKARSAEKTAKNQLNQATTKWKHEVQTKERAEIQLRQYKDEVMMLQEALVIASKDMAKMQVLAGVAEAETEGDALPTTNTAAGGAALDTLPGTDDLRVEAKELLYAYLDDLGHGSVPLSADDEDTLVSVLVQASEVGIRTRIDKFMRALSTPNKPKTKIIIREDGAFKKIS